MHARMDCILGLVTSMETWKNSSPTQGEKENNRAFQPPLLSICPLINSISTTVYPAAYRHTFRSRSGGRG